MVNPVRRQPAVVAAVCALLMVVGACSSSSDSASTSGTTANTTAQACPDQDPIQEDKYVVAYYSTSFYDGPYPVSALPVDKFNVAIYGFGNVGSDNKVSLTPADESALQELVELRNKNCYLRVMLSIGGWGGRALWTNMLTSTQNRKTFMESVMNVLDQYGLDGIDLDWENWDLAPQEEIEGLASLFAEAAAAMEGTKGATGLARWATSPVGAPPFSQERAPTPKQTAVLDMVMVQGYGLEGTFGPWAAHTSNLREDPANPYQITPSDPKFPTNKPLSAQQALDWFGSEIPPERIIFGIPIFGQSYYTKSNKNGGLFADVYDSNISAQVSYGTALYELFGTCGNPKKDNAVFYDEVSQAYYYFQSAKASNQNLSEFISSDQPLAVANKIRFAKKRNYAGFMYWGVGSDAPIDSDGSIVETVYQGYQKGADKSAPQLPEPKLAKVSDGVYKCLK